MIILSLFDGISCAHVALERAKIKVDKYYASEIDKYAIQITQKNYPNTIQVGDITKLKGNDFKDVGLLIGGSPCQDLSIAKKNREGLKGSRSSLFWEYVRLLKEINPKYFILENVASMPKEAKEIISKTLGVEPIMINASLVSAQQRKRLFWTNIPDVNQPKDKYIYLKDIIDNAITEKDKLYCIDAQYYKRTNLNHYIQKGVRQLVFEKPNRIGNIGNKGQGSRVYSVNGKSVVLGSNGGGWGANTGLYLVSKKHLEAMKRCNKNFKTRDLNGKSTAITSTYYKIPSDGNYLEVGDYVRKLTPLECERLQCLPDNYTLGISNTQRYKSIGNGFNVDVVVHILSFIPKNAK